MENEKILLKIAEIEKYVLECQEYLPEKKAQFLKSILHQRAVERILQMIIDCVLDICAILVHDLKLGPPKDEDNILDLLKNKLKCIEKVKEMKKFRNILVHRYGVIDNSIVYQNAKENLDDFYTFINEIKTVIKEKKK